VSSVAATVDTERSVRRFLSENFPLVDGAAVGRGDSLVAAGVIDSTGVLELVDFVETEFGLPVPDEELVPQNFDSIECIVAYVARKRSGDG
jgi:acyl carrier protein